MFRALCILSLTLLISGTAGAQWSGDANTQTFQGNVGVGLTAPTGKLEVRNLAGGYGNGTYLQITGSITDNLNYPDIVLKGGTLATYYPSIKLSNAGYALLLSSGASAALPNPVSLLLDTGSQTLRIMTGSTTLMTTSAVNGLVNIGEYPNPQTGDKLVVNGTVRGNNIVAHYQDIAEWAPATETMSPGTVVVIDGHSHNTVAPSAHAYDTRVAGVVSVQPGLTLGEPAADRELIATTGRVKVHVDASHGAIRQGDLLVTSDKPGVAMRSTPIDIGGVSIHRPGTIIGKALQPLATGEGEILVLLSLQ